MEIWQDRIHMVAKLLQEAILLALSDRDDSAVARSELTLCLGILHPLEALEVGTTAELIVTIHIAIVHDDPALAIQRATYAHALDSLFGLFDILLEASPLRTSTLTTLWGEVLGGSLVDATPTLALVEEVVQAIRLVIDYIAINGRAAIVEEVLRLALQIGEIFVDIAIIYTVKRILVIGT